MKKQINQSKPFEQFMKELKAERKWGKEHYVLQFFIDTYNFILYRIPTIIQDIRREIEWGFQRMFRGYDDPMVWNYYCENARLNIKILKHFKKGGLKCTKLMS